MKRWIFKKICTLLKVEEGVSAPEWLTWTFFPLIKYALNVAKVRYDFCNQVYTIQGVKISKSVFSGWGKRGIPEGGCFRLLRREKDGMIYLERIE